MYSLVYGQFHQVMTSMVPLDGAFATLRTLECVKQLCSLIVEAILTESSMLVEN
jgi:hypothetical protein